MNNIYLTGFMSSGKTTVSMLLSETLNKPLYDTDDLIINKTNLTINDIFVKFGEEYFRGLETEILEEVSKKEVDDKNYARSEQELKLLRKKISNKKYYSK